jgi:hypothetical protein
MELDQVTGRGFWSSNSVHAVVQLLAACCAKTAAGHVVTGAESQPCT